jgi:hypothetical protein
MVGFIFIWIHYQLLAHFWHSMWWDLFLNELDVNFLFIIASVHRVYNTFSSQMIEILPHSFFWHSIWWDPFFYESDVKILCTSVSVRRVYKKFSSQFPQQLLISGAWNFSTVFLWACHMVRFIFVLIRYQLTV